MGNLEKNHPEIARELAEHEAETDAKISAALLVQKRKGVKLIWRARSALYKRRKKGIWANIDYEIRQMRRCFRYVVKYKWLSPNQKRMLRYWINPAGYGDQNPYVHAGDKKHWKYPGERAFTKGIDIHGLSITTAPKRELELISDDDIYITTKRRVKDIDDR